MQLSGETMIKTGKIWSKGIYSSSKNTKIEPKHSWFCIPLIINML